MSSFRSPCVAYAGKLAVNEAMKKQKTWLLKNNIGFGQFEMHNTQGLDKGYQLQPSASADNPYLGLDHSGYHKNLSNNCFLYG